MVSPGDAVRDEIAYDRLGQYLKALSNPLRLEMLFKLRFPKRAADIQVVPRRADKRFASDRPMSRQAVSEHLQVLEAIGVVTRLPSDGQSDDYVTNHQRVFAIIEEMRKLTLIKPRTSVQEATMDAPTGGAAGPEWVDGPKLVLVAGNEEGRAFPLGVDVRLDYDPFVSAANARVTRDGDAFAVAALPEARNGTLVNFQRVEKEPVALKPGDVLGVGRSLLVFQAE